jgi:hypothetical protein
MSPDAKYAAAIVIFLGSVITQKQFSATVLELLLKLTRPGATIVLLGLLVVVYTKGLHYTFLAVGITVVFLLKDLWTAWPRSDARRLYLEIGRDQSRFDPASSIDIQMADKSVTHSSPELYHKAPTQDGLLVFPPSSETLESMCGS